jgi:ribonuclease J
MLALGGIGEIGMNCYLYGVGPPDRRQWLMVDLGITFPDPEQEPGVDVILPKLDFIAEHADSLVGLVLTHAHEDHFGAVIELWEQIRCPVYATPFSAALLKVRLAEGGGRLKLPITEVALGSRFKAGPFDIEMVNVAHSIPEPNGLAIRTPYGMVFHTGDWKLDNEPLIGLPADEARFQQLGEEGVRALVCDSTNAFRDGRSPSELEVTRSLTKLIADANRAVAVTTFASNVARIRAVSDAARATGRELVVAGRALHRFIEVAVDTGYLPKTFRYRDQQDFRHMEPRKVLALCTGSQGEPRAAMARIAAGEHPDILLGLDDLVIFSSRTIPGNERPVGRIQNQLVHRGCRLVTDTDTLVHVTGHPRRDELRQMFAWMRPQIVIPMHGEMRHLKENARLARAAGVPHVLTPVNGDMVVLAPGAPAIIDEAPVGRIFRDGRLLIDSEAEPVRERRKLAYVGIVVVALTLSRRGQLVADPVVELDGVPRLDEGEDSMENLVMDAADGAYSSIPQGRRRDRELVREAVRRSVRAAVDRAWGKKPIVKVLICSPDD